MDTYRENMTFSSPYQDNTNNSFSNKTIIIILLSVLVILAILGINLLTFGGNLLEVFTKFINNLLTIIKPFIVSLLSIFGYTTGYTLNTTSNIIANTGKTSLDIADGSIHSLGNIFIQSSLPNIKPEEKKNIDNTLNLSTIRFNTPQTDTTASPIQNPISSNKSNWCLVGDYAGKRGCIEIGEHDKCMSNQVFPTQQLCLNPNTSH
jgi:hypothetical protein